MRKMQTFGLIILVYCAIMGAMAFSSKADAKQQQKAYTLTLSAQETQVVFDALGELPAKTSEGIRAKIAQQVQNQNQSTDKK